MKHQPSIKIHRKKPRLSSAKLLFLKHPKLIIPATFVLTFAVLAAIFYQTINPTEALTNTITVTDNNQTITTTQDNNITIINKASIVNVKDTSATDGYSLTAALNTTLPAGSTVQIYPDSASITANKTSTCNNTNPCSLASTPTTILSDDNDISGIANGETTTFNVIITIPAGTNIGNYTVDIAYDEILPFAVTITNPAADQALAYGTTSTNLVVTTNKVATCKYGTNNVAYNSLPDTFEDTNSTTHSQSITVANGGHYTYYVACRSMDGHVSNTTARSWSVSSSPPATKIIADGDDIQNVTSTMCTAATVFRGTNIDAISLVKDDRDDRYYAIAKMPDNKCWMITNLAYGGNADGSSINNHGVSFGTMTHYTGDGSSSWTESSTSAAYYVDPYTDSAPNGGRVAQHLGTACTSSYRTTAGSIDYTECGYLYNWYAATAGTGTANMTNSEATASICPTGWRLPKINLVGGQWNGGDPKDLYTALGSQHSSLIGASSIWRGVYSGYFNPRTTNYFGLVNQSNDGEYWSSRAGTQSWATPAFSFSTTRVSAGTNTYKYDGGAIRCIAGS
ncbi:MAG: fibrobacter succinogenes major paralogous domain-containing protein [Candidatus Nomurabacteria bacterium]|jgi:uncharacterized protein (TIGR02145 family)|nr:fibrobacter succinogenes major paralogous domain-containing protein [Candidatus Nomurabacteria bacterium]